MFESVDDDGWSPIQVIPAPVEPDQAEDLTAVPTDQLEARVCTLAGHLASATCRWLLLLGEYDTRNGWAGPGIRSCAHWLSWRCGMSMPAARAHVRVARALRGLPLVTAEFTAGRLSYSKVRSIVRVATPELESKLVDLALTTPAAQLDHVVSAYRRAEALHRRPSGRPNRSTTWRWDDDGSLVIRARLAPEEGALFLAAIDAARSHLDSDSGDVGDPAGPPSERQGDGHGDGHGDLCERDETAVAYRCSRTDGFVAMTATALAAGPVDTSGSDRYQVVIHADLDQLREAPGTTPHPTTDGLSRSGRDQAERVGRNSVARGRCHLQGGPCIHPATLHRLACDAALRVMIHGPDGSPKDAGRRVRLATGDLRRLLEERDQRRCRFPACHHTRFLHAHHIVHWADGGHTTLDNLILLCGFHHRLLHEHGYTITTIEPGVFTFHRPDGELITPAPALTGQPSLHALPRQLHTPARITENTTTPTWAGERLDLGYIVSLLFPPDPPDPPDAERLAG